MMGGTKSGGGNRRFPSDPSHHDVVPRWWVFIAACIYTSVIRLLPYALPLVGMEIDPTLWTWPWNFSPALALCVFGGAMLPQRSTGLIAPLAVWFVGDLGIWALTGHADWAFYPGQWSVYVALMLCVTVGWLLRRKRSWGGVIATSLVTPWLFFFLTNAVHWASYATYPRDLAGLLECFELALPFQRNLVASTLVFNVLLFSPMGLRLPVAEEERRALPVA